MKHKITIALFKILFGFFVFVLPLNCVFGQVIDPVVIEGGRICASIDINGPSPHYLNFDITGGSFPPGTNFTAELSSDLFNTVYITTTFSTQQVSATKVRLGFNVPSNIIGSETYRIRIRTSPFNYVSQPFGLNGADFAAYFKSYTGSFKINGGNNANICAGGSITLAIDPGTPTTSPLSFSNLKYRWESSPTSAGPFTVISGQIGSTLLVNSSGFYQARIEYGGCTSGSINTVSNTVQVTQAGNGTVYTITSTTPNPVCSGSGTVLSVPAGSSYKWFKDNVEIVTIPPATTNSYNATQSGVYFVKVSCGGSTIESDRYRVIIKSIDAKINRFVAPQVNFVLLGESLVVTASSTATTPTYEWFFEGNSVLGQTSNIFTATLPGNYSVKVSEAAPGCLSIEEIKFILKNGVPPVNIPNVISPNNDGINDTWIIPQKYLSGSKTEIQILTAQGKVELTTTDYKNDWPNSSIDFKNTNPIYYYIITTANQETKMGSITVIK